MDGYDANLSNVWAADIFHGSLMLEAQGAETRMNPLLDKLSASDYVDRIMLHILAVAEPAGHG